MFYIVVEGKGKLTHTNKWDFLKRDVLSIINILEWQIYRFTTAKKVVGWELLLQKQLQLMRVKESFFSVF